MSLFGDVNEWKPARCRAIATEQNRCWQHVESLQRRTYPPERHSDRWWNSHLPERHRCIMASVGNVKHYYWSDLSPAETCPRQWSSSVLTSSFRYRLKHQTNKHPFAVVGLPGSNISPRLHCSYRFSSLLESLEVWGRAVLFLSLALFLGPSPPSLPFPLFLASSLKKMKPIFQSPQETNYS